MGAAGRPRQCLIESCVLILAECVAVVECGLIEELYGGGVDGWYVKVSGGVASSFGFVVHVHSYFLERP